MADNQKRANDLKEVLKKELKNLKSEILANTQAQIGNSERKILRVFRNENRRVMSAIANIALNSPTLSMFKELEEKFDRYFSKN